MRVIVLGHIVGSKDVSRSVAGHVAKESGISNGILKNRLPVAAMFVMSTMKKKAGSSGLQKQAGGGGLIEGCSIVAMIVQSLMIS